MNLSEIFIKSYPKAGPEAKAKINSAQQKIAILKAQGFGDVAVVFEQDISRKLQNNSFDTLGKDLENLAGFYGENTKRERSGEETQSQREKVSAARIEAGLAVLKSNVQKSKEPVDPNLVSIAENLIRSGDTEGAEKISASLFKQPMSTSEQLDIMELEEKKEEKVLKNAEAEDTYYSIQSEREKIKKLLASDLSDVVGPTEPVARFGRAAASEFGAEWAQENQSLIKDALMVTTSDVLKSVRALAPVTEQDRKFISKMTVPVETDNAKIWKDYLTEKDEVLSRAERNLDKKYNISGIPATSEPDIKPDKPQTATQKLRGRLQ